MLDPAALGPMALSVFSAVTLALANFAVKRGGDVLVARAIFAMAAALTAAPFAFFVSAPPKELWLPLLGAVVVHWFYQIAMVRALHRGDLSAVFPVMRGVAPLLTAATAFVFLGEALSWVSVIGLIAASGALITFGVAPSAEHHVRRLHFSSLFWAVMTAVGISLYSVVDARVARASPSAMTFAVWLFLLDWIGVTAAALWIRRGAFFAAAKKQFVTGAAGGVIGMFSYAAALIAFTQTDVAMVTATRETAGFFAAILGVLFLNEQFGRRRIVAAAVLAAGLATMRLGAG